MKLIGSGPIPGPGILRLLFHANPDRLVELAAAAKDADPATRNQLAQEFCKIMQDIRIGDIWRQTSGGRLPETENAIIRYMNRLDRPRDEALQILDLGASDGITTVDLVNAIRNASDQPIKTYLADLNLALFRYRNGNYVEYRCSQGKPVMARIGPLGIRLPTSEHSWNLPAHALAYWYLRKERMRAEMWLECEVPLVSPLATDDLDITPIQMDCIKRNDDLVGGVDILRTSNIILVQYGFVGSRLQTVLGHLHAYLRNGGCLLISRNDRFSEAERGSVWLRHAEGFRHIEDFGGGSEIKKEVSDFLAHNRSLSVPDGCADHVAGGIDPSGQAGTNKRTGLSQ